MSSKAITTGVQSGVVIKTTSEGVDPDFSNVTGLLSDCQYLRLKNADNTYVYVPLNEIDILRSEIESKASTIDVELMQSDIDDKATKSQLEAVKNIAETNVVDEETINSILSSIDNKAEKSVVEGIAAELLTKADTTDVESLAEIVEGKASQTSVDNLITDLNTLKTALGGVTDENVVAAIERQINYLNNEINKRLTIDDILPINSSVSNISSIISTLDSKVTEVESRLEDTPTIGGVSAIRTDVDELMDIVNKLESKISTKADSTALAAKASHNELLKVAQRVSTLSNTINDKFTELTDAVNDTNKSLSYKVGIAAHTLAVNEINEKLDLKSDKKIVSAQIQQIETDLKTLKRNLEGLEDSMPIDFQPQMDAIKSKVDSTNTKLREVTDTTKTLTNTVGKLNNWKEETAKNLKSQWVRVLSSKEYKNLRPAGENTLDNYNPRYRYPNTVYLVVDFNRPKAIYIGDILIAKSEINGSIGFAYTFPISF
jgi:hypothetical protein